MIRHRRVKKGIRIMPRRVRKGIMIMPRRVRVLMLNKQNTGLYHYVIYLKYQISIILSFFKFIFFFRIQGPNHRIERYSVRWVS